MNRDLIDKIIDRVRQDLYAEISMEEETVEEEGGPTNVIGDGEGAVKLRPTLMKFAHGIENQNLIGVGITYKGVWPFTRISLKGRADTLSFVR